MKWQPIETAPKTGEVFLAYWKHMPVFVAWIDGGKKEKAGFRVLMPGRDLDLYIHGNFAPFTPTHWRPLPEPPTPENSERFSKTL